MTNSQNVDDCLPPRTSGKQHRRAEEGDKMGWHSGMMKGLTSHIGKPYTYTDISATTQYRPTDISVGSYNIHQVLQQKLKLLLLFFQELQQQLQHWQQRTDDMLQEKQQELNIVSCKRIVNLDRLTEMRRKVSISYWWKSVSEQLLLLNRLHTQILDDH